MARSFSSDSTSNYNIGLGRILISFLTFFEVFIKDCPPAFQFIHSLPLNLKYPHTITTKKKESFCNYFHLPTSFFRNVQQHLSFISDIPDYFNTESIFAFNLLYVIPKKKP